MKKMESHLAKMETQLKKWGVRIEKMITKSENAGTEANSDYHMRIDQLKTKQQVAQTKFEELKASGTDDWETFKAGMSGVWSELEVAFKLESTSKRAVEVLEIETQLCSWSKQLDDLVVGYQNAGGQTNDTYHIRIDNLRGLHGAVQTKFNEFANSSAGSPKWGTFHATIANDWTALKSGFEELAH